MMTVFDKFRNCITEPRCRDCEGIPGVCEYDHQSVKIPKVLALDVLELLKEQEPVPPIQREVMHILVWCCGSCGVGITHGDKFCRMCGREVKWE